MCKAVLVSALLAALVPGLAIAAEEGSPQTETASQALERSLKPVRDQITNMQAKIQRGVAGVAPPEDPNAPPVVGWVAACCTRNLRALHKAIPELEGHAARLARSFREIGREDGESFATELALDARVLARFLEQFAAAPTEAEARKVLEHVINATINLNIDQRSLARCCDDLTFPK